MKTTIIIPNYNGLSFMEPCFEALDRQTTKDFKILCGGQRIHGRKCGVAEGETDPVDLSSENTGFSGAVNVGIKAADTRM